MLLPRESRRLAGRAARKNTVDAFLHLKLDQATKRIVVDLPVRRERSHQGGPHTMGSKGPTHAGTLAFFVPKESGIVLDQNPKKAHQRDKWQRWQRLWSWVHS